MVRSRRNALCIIAFAIVATLVSWRAYGLFAMPAVEPHAGDGQFKNHSWRFPHDRFGVPVAGYTIDFEKFDLGRPFEATYRIEQLPTFGNRVGVYLSVVDVHGKYDRLEARKSLAAVVEISVVDQNGVVVSEVEQPLGKLIWAGGEGGADTHGLYDLDDSFFAPAEGGRYEIRIRYRPDPQLSGMSGFVHIRCGGSI